MDYKIKIAIVSLFGVSSEGGIERVAYYLKDILSEKYETEIFSMEKSFGKLNILIYPIVLSLKLMMTKNCIVISHAWHSWLYPAEYVFSHGTTKGTFKYLSEDKSFGGKLIMFMEKVSVKRSKKVIAVSNNCKKELIALYHIPKEKIIVLNNFVDERVFHPLNDVGKHDKLIIIFVGRLIERKGLSSLVKLAKYIENICDVELRIACNDDTNKNRFSEFKHTQVEVGLSINEMNLFYSKGDVLYFPTLYEGFPMCSLEALSSGLPIIGTGFAIPEEIRKYSFTEIIDINDMNMVVEKARNLKGKYAHRRLEIHDIIMRDFGRTQYMEKMLGLVKNVEKNFDKN